MFGGYGIFEDGDMFVFPDYAAMAPHPDMPEDALVDYREVASVLTRSPRSAAALLRLAIECRPSGIMGLF